MVWLRADGSWEQQGLSLLVSPGGELRDITSKDPLLRPALSLGNKEEVAVLLHHRKGQMEDEAKSLCHLGRLFDPLHLRVRHSRWCPQGKVAWLGYSDLLPYYLVCAHYWLYNFKDICLLLIAVCVCVCGCACTCANEGQESSVPEPPVTCLTWVLGTIPWVSCKRSRHPSPLSHLVPCTGQMVQPL